MPRPASDIQAPTDKPAVRHGGLTPPPMPARRYALERQHLRFLPLLADHNDHPHRWHFPDFLNPAVPWVAALKDLYESPLAFPASMAPETGLLIHSLIRNIRPRLVIEIGSFMGASTVWIAAALEAASNDPAQTPPTKLPRRGMVHAFDDFGPVPKGPWRDAELQSSRLPLVQGLIDRAGIADRVVLHPGDSSSNILAFRDGIRSPESPWGDEPASGGIDFAFIDGDHTIKGVLKDFWAIEPVLNTGGYVLLHDTLPEQCGDHMGPRHLLDHLREVAQGTYELCELYTAPLNYGMALLRRIG